MWPNLSIAGACEITRATNNPGLKEYELTSTKVALKDHVGHKVSVTGTLKKENRDEDEGEDEKNSGGQLEVTVLKMISKTCG